MMNKSGIPQNSAQTAKQVHRRPSQAGQTARRSIAGFRLGPLRVRPARLAGFFRPGAMRSHASGFVPINPAPEADSPAIRQQDEEPDERHEAKCAPNDVEPAP